MRAVLDLGGVQSTLTSDHPLVRLLADLVRRGGPEFDLRVALNGTDDTAMAAAQDALGGALPRLAMSGYVLPQRSRIEAEAGDDVDREMRRQHLAALMPDVVLVPDGAGLRLEGPPSGETGRLTGEHRDAAMLLAALRTAVSGPPGWPAAETALPVLADAIARGGCGAPPAIADALIRSARVGQEVGPPRLLVDVTGTHRHDHGTGIQRVVRRIDEALRAAPTGRRHAETTGVAFSHGIFRPVAAIGGDEGAPLLHRTGDTLLMLDALWGDYPDIADTFARVRRHGGRVVTAVYDIVPLLHPAVTADTLPRTFGLWFRHAVAQSDGLVCISRAVADEVAAYILDHALPHRDGLRIGWWHLGSDLSSVEHGAPGDAVSHFLAEDLPTFLMVGTVEPRKRHAVALSAAEMLWDRGRDARLLILGREGWNVADLVQRLRCHPETRRRLLWRAAATDDDIAHAYGRATALLFPSLTEGYGLPISEAARAGLGAIASDIPVLREVGGDGAVYVPVDDPRALAEAMEAVMDGAGPDPSTARILSWRESAAQLLEILDADRWHVTLRDREHEARTRNARAIDPRSARGDVPSAIGRPRRKTAARGRLLRGEGT